MRCLITNGKEGEREGLNDDESEVEEELKEAPEVRAGKELKTLLEELMNAAANGEGEGYVALPEGDSAAARFLVRANMAVYHPRDARRVKLVDYGRNIEN